MMKGFDTEKMGIAIALVEAFRVMRVKASCVRSFAS